MKLTLFTDYSMRVLLYLGARTERLCSIAEIAQAYRISQNHLMKVVNQLARQGYVQSVRGRSGGIRLGRPPQDINLGALVRDTEEGLVLVDCGSCVVARASKFSSRWVPGSSFEPRISWLVLVADTTMKYSGNTDASAATDRNR